MSELYIRDNLLPKDFDGKGARRTRDDLLSILSEIISQPPGYIVERRLGFLVFYNEDRDVNSYFKPEIKNKLQQHHLLARLSYATQAKREIYILKTPDSIYNKADDLLTAEIEHKNNITVLKLDKFCSNKLQNIYLKNYP